MLVQLAHHVTYIEQPHALLRLYLDIRLTSVFRTTDTMAHLIPINTYTNL
jgi:hypothetical protein